MRQDRVATNTDLDERHSSLRRMRARHAERRFAGQSAAMVFRLLIAFVSTLLCVLGIISLVVVDLSSGVLDVSGSVLGVGFSPASTVIAIVLGTLISVAAVFSEDRGSTGLGGILLAASGIIGVMVRGDVLVNGAHAGIASIAFVIVGAIVFGLSVARAT